jgi:hypothetical protein
MQVQRRLRVYPLWREDVFKDIPRIPMKDRGEIGEGSVCTVSANGYKKQLIIRGLEEQLNGGIMLDEITRGTMGKLQEGVSYDVSIKETGIWGQIKWACTVADRGARISAWIGVVSIALGILGAVLGAVGLWISEHPLVRTQPGVPRFCDRTLHAAVRFRFFGSASGATVRSGERSSSLSLSGSAEKGTAREKSSWVSSPTSPSSFVHGFWLAMPAPGINLQFN